MLALVSLVSPPVRRSTARRGAWDYRHLLFQLAKRDLTVRYRHSFLGVVWSLLHPFLMMGVLAAVFTYVGRFNEGIPHYPAYILCGYLPWLFLANTLSGSVRSVVDAAPLMRKAAFPRQVLPLAVVASNLVNFLVSLMPLCVFLVLSGVRLGPRVILVIPAVAVQVAFLSGGALFLSAAHVYARDVGVILEVVLFGWFYLCPVFYPPSMILSHAPGWLSTAYFLNPMASLMVLYRSALMDLATPHLDLRLWGAVAALVSVATLAAGWAFFSWRQHSFVEEL